MIASYHDVMSSNREPSYDSSGNTKIILNSLQALFITHIGVEGDSIFALGQQSIVAIGSPPNRDTIHFILDTIQKTVRNFYFAYVNYSSSYNFAEQFATNENFRILFSNLNYVKDAGDSLLIVNTSGKICKESIDSVKYDVYKSDQYYHRGSYIDGNDTTHLIQLSDDTASYQCSLTFSLSVLSNVVLVNSIKHNFTVTYSLPNQIINYSFSACDHSQQMTIYDILGREVKRIEIPSGVSEYRLQRDGFMSGYYFARLGSQTAKFVVN